MNVIFQGKGFSVAPLGDDDLPAALDVYLQCEDFLSLGPVAKATLEMVEKDLTQSRQEHGTYCGIRNDTGELIGVLDFISRPTAYLSLLMIAKPHRSRGLGTAVMSGLEAYLKQTAGCVLIESGVQVNNDIGIRFWKKYGFNISDDAKNLPDGTTTHPMKKEI
jgi:ribosomal protein S18 acetylase RimI-like enzyme